ncbi:unnamed protein product [Peronospora effusa]|nr:unnamed protein product [Peronospora effusa]
MPINLTKTFFAKTLFVILLVAPLTMGMGTADLSPEDGPRILQASDAFYLDLTIPASKQHGYLRMASDVTPREARRLGPLKIKDLESLVKKDELPLPTTLSQSVSTMLSESGRKFRKRMWLQSNKQKSAGDIFISLKLHEDGNPFKNRLFPLWKYFVEKTTRKQDVSKVMFEAMAANLKGENNVIKVILEAKTSNIYKDTVDSLYDYQIAQWVSTGKNPETVYKYLNLDKEKNLKDALTHPEFNMWAEYNTMKKSIDQAFEYLKGPESKMIDLDLLEGLAEIGEADGSFKFAQDLLLSQLHFFKKESIDLKTSFDLLKLQRKDTANSIDLTTNPLGRLWSDFVYMKAQDESGLIHFDVVFDELYERVGFNGALAVIEKVDSDGHFLISLKEKPMKRNEDLIEELYNSMAKTLGGEGNVAKNIAQAKDSTKFGYLGESVYNYQIKQWALQKATSEHVFDVLDLNEKKNLEKFPYLPEFSMWGAFNTKMFWETKAFEVLKGPDSLIMDLKLMRNLYEVHAVNRRSSFLKGLVQSQLEFLDTKNIKPEEVFKLFKLQGKGTPKPTDLITDPLGNFWVDYVYKMARGNDPSTYLGNVREFLTDSVDPAMAAHAMNEAKQDVYFLKALNVRDYLRMHDSLHPKQSTKH